MLKSFFFIPGSHKKLIEKINTINADQIIIDLEDAVDNNRIDAIIGKLREINNKEKIFFRPNFFINDVFNDKLFLELESIGINKFIIPKFKNLNQLQSIEKLITKASLFSFILLIENPESLFSLKEILSKTKLNIVGIGFGSHDYCTSVGMKHDIDLLHYPRFIISGLAKVFGYYSIDIASMELDNKTLFSQEVESAYDYGFDAKFIIHPNQLSLLKQNNEKEIKEAVEIIQTYNELGKPAVFKYRGRAVEPPHIKYYNNLIKRKQKNETK